MCEKVGECWGMLKQIFALEMWPVDVECDNNLALSSQGHDVASLRSEQQHQSRL